MIKNLDTLSKAEILRRLNMGYIFGLAPHLGIWFDDKPQKCHNGNSKAPNLNIDLNIGRQRLAPRDMRRRA